MSMRARWLRVGLLCALAAGCGRAPRHEPWAADVAARHLDADRRLDEGDAEGARAALLALIAAHAPSPSDPGDRRLAAQDTYFRLARLALAGRDARQALGYADAGLGLGTPDHLFVANLFVARGAAHEALGDGRAAAADYHRALVINDALLRQAVPR